MLLVLLLWFDLHGGVSVWIHRNLSSCLRCTPPLNIPSRCVDLWWWGRELENRHKSGKGIVFYYKNQQNHILYGREREFLFFQSFMSSPLALSVGRVMIIHIGRAGQTVWAWSVGSVAAARTCRAHKTCLRINLGENWNYFLYIEINIQNGMNCRERKRVRPRVRLSPNKVPRVSAWPHKLEGKKVLYSFYFIFLVDDNSTWIWIWT